MTRYELMQGDCLDLMRQIPAGSVDAVICDLPYGTTACKWDVVIPFVEMWEGICRVSRPNSPVVLFANQPFTSQLISSNLSMFRYCWTWRKSRVTGFLNAKKQPLRCTEDIAVFYETQAVFNPQMTKVKERYVSRSGEYSGYGKHRALNSSNGGMQHPFNVLEFPSEELNLHPTQKPVSLMKYLVFTHTNKGDTVLDFTMGSGTTGVACLQTGRKFIGIEKDPDYFCIAQKRIAEAAAQGMLFDSLTAEDETEQRESQEILPF